MTHLIANDAMIAILGQAKELAEIRDTNGKVLGFFAPASIPQAEAAVVAASRINPAELQRRIANTAESRTTREVFEHLLTLTNDETTRAHLQAKIEGLKERDRCPSP